MRPWQCGDQRQVGRPCGSRCIGAIGAYGHYIATQDVHWRIVCGGSLQGRPQSMQQFTASETNDLHTCCTGVARIAMGRNSSSRLHKA